MTVWATSTPSLYGSLARMATYVPGVPGTGKTHNGAPSINTLLSQ